MVVSPNIISPFNNWAICSIRKFSNSSIYLFFILDMNTVKKIWSKYKGFIFKVNSFVIAFLLAMIYFCIITPYSLFYRKKRVWVNRYKYLKWEDTIQMW